jgi:hypothetical protein
MGAIEPHLLLHLRGASLIAPDPGENVLLLLVFQVLVGRVGRAMANQFRGLTGLVAGFDELPMEPAGPAATGEEEKGQGDSRAGHERTSMLKE